MNKLSKTQREQLLGITIGTVVLMAVLWYFGVTAKQAQLSQNEKKTAQIQDTLGNAEDKMRHAQDVADKLQVRLEILDRREATLAPDRDAYAWLITTFNAFLQSHTGVKINRYSQPELSEAGIIPNFPYKWATFRLEGTGHFHDIGKFIADLENEFPYDRVQNLALGVNAGAGVEPELLSFTYDLVVPVKPSDTK